MSNETVASKNRQTAVAILWMCSGVIILLASALLQTLFHFLVPQPAVTDMSTGMTIFTVVNIISVLSGLVGMIMIPVGVIVGGIKLSKLS